MMTQVSRVSWSDRMQARLISLSGEGDHPDLEADLRSLGSAERARAMLEGQFPFADTTVTSTSSPPDIWALAAPTAEFELGRQGFDWLEDLAALASKDAHLTARRWAVDWQRRYGRGSGPGWTPLAVSRHLGRLIDFSDWLRVGADPTETRMLGLSTVRLGRFLSRRVGSMPRGAAKVEAGCVLLRATMLIDALSADRDKARTIVENVCQSVFADSSGIAGRNPEALQNTFFQMTRAAEALHGAGLSPDAHLQAAIEKSVWLLRALRHSDGSLGRFHGGSAGDPFRLDTGFAIARVVTGPVRGLQLGFGRLERARSTVLIDAAGPSTASTSAHASTLAFEMTSGRRPIIVSVGAGNGFGPEWHLAARATPSHSTLVIDGLSTARIVESGPKKGQIVDGPTDVQTDLSLDDKTASVVAAHNGYAVSHGLIHVRRLDLSETGRRLTGEDVLTSVTETEKRALDVALRNFSAQRGGVQGLPFALHFHLHPDVVAEPGVDGTTVRLKLLSGEIWLFSHTGTCSIRLDPAVYLENTRSEPIASQQIVLTGRAGRAASSVRWTLTKSTETPDYLHDLERDAP